MTKAQKRNQLFFTHLAAIAVLLPMHQADARGFQVLYTFQGGATGGNPVSGLVRDESGNLYGVVNAGGSDTSSCPSGCGLVFKLAPDGSESVVHAFAGGTDGAGPGGNLLIDKSGTLYGTTSYGGTTGCSGIGCGTVYKLTASGTETILYSFAGGDDGSYPVVGLTADKSGNLYGTTSDGGVGGWGTIFEISAAGAETIIHAFDKSDGATPLAPVLLDSSGDIFATTFRGGNYDGGTAIKFSPDGVVTVLHSFGGSGDGTHPSGLISDAQGDLLGTTNQGGTYDYGTVFEIRTDGTESLLYSFAGGADGEYPSTALISDRNGNYYGATQLGGGGIGCDFGCGNIFEITSDGTKTILHAFKLGEKAAYPDGDLLLHKGLLYGTANHGGEFGHDCNETCGAVFELKK